jgi:glycylpeptide N-tetradecanoyltransferase
MRLQLVDIASVDLAWLQTPKTEGLRAMTLADVPTAFRLLSDYLKRFDLVPIFTQEEFQHFFLPRSNVIYCFVKTVRARAICIPPSTPIQAVGGRVTDLISFYALPSSVMHHPTYKAIRAAYAFYNVATSVPIVQLLNDALILAHNVREGGVHGFQRVVQWKGVGV